MVAKSRRIKILACLQHSHTVLQWYASYPGCITDVSHTRVRRSSLFCPATIDAWIGTGSRQILVTEIGDETFIIAALMAMRHPKLIVYGGAMSALAVMTVRRSIPCPGLGIWRDASNTGSSPPGLGTSAGHIDSAGVHRPASHLAEDDSISCHRSVPLLREPALLYCLQVKQ